MNKKKQEFSKIYDDCIDRIYRFVFFKVNSEEIAQDLCSETFLKAWQAFKKNNEEIENPQAFLYQIARNLVIDHYREKGAVQVVPTESVSITDSGEDLEQKAFDNSEIEMIKTALRKIKQDYQELIVWHYIDDYTIPEIAKMVDKKEGTVRVMLHRSLKALKKEISHFEQA